MDSDGCITIKRRKQDDAVYYALFLVVAQVGDGNDPPPVIAQLKTLYGGSLQMREGSGRRRRMWHWSVATNQAEITLRRLAPHLVGKADQAALALEYREKAMGRGKRALAESYYRRLQTVKKQS